MRRTLAALVLLCCLPAALAQVYKWTDAAGVVHYAETPPAKGKYQTIATHGSAEPLSPPVAAAPAAASSAAGQPAPLEDTPANRAKLCDDVKHNLALLQGGGALNVKDAKGAIQPMSAEQHQRELAQAQQQYKDYCGK